MWKKEKKVIDMTEGAIAPSIIKFAIPLFMGSMFTKLYSMVDSVIVGQFVGSNALAAIGGAMPMLQIMIAIMIGLNVGTSVVLSKHVGAKDEEGMRNAFANSLYLFVLVPIFVAVVGCALTDPVLRWMQTPAEILEDAKLYLYISFSTCILEMFFYLFGATFRSLGNSSTPVLFQVISSCMNIVLDLIFVCVFDWAVAGVAWATVISQGASAVLAGIMLVRMYPSLHLRKSNFKPQRKLFFSIAKVAIPMSIQNSFTGLASVIVQSYVNIFGVAAVAAYACATKIGDIALQAVMCIGNTISVFIGQNYGAKKWDRMKRGVKVSVGAVVVSGGVMAILLWVFGKYLIQMFVGNDSEIIAIAWEYLMIVSMPVFLAGLAYVYQFAMRGLEQGTIPMIAGFIELIVKVTVAFIGAKVVGDLTLVWLAWPISYVASGVFAMIGFYICLKNKRKSVN